MGSFQLAHFKKKKIKISLQEPQSYNMAPTKSLIKYSSYPGNLLCFSFNLIEEVHGIQIRGVGNKKTCHNELETRKHAIT
jgi:hypothetical protein